MSHINHTTARSDSNPDTHSTLLSLVFLFYPFRFWNWTTFIPWANYLNRYSLHPSAIRSSTLAHTAWSPFARWKNPATARHIPSIRSWFFAPKIRITISLLQWQHGTGGCPWGRTGRSIFIPSNMRLTRPVEIVSTSNHEPGNMVLLSSSIGGVSRTRDSTYGVEDLNSNPTR